ncbi:MAG: C45 family autoproteolytic acyltransferase/hydrolase [Bacillota bacterium]
MGTNRPKKNKILLGLVLPGLMLFTVMADSVRACTLWGATGLTTRDHLTLVAKNRDWTPKQQQWLEKIPASGDKFGFLGLCAALPGKKAGIKAGINEKGLVVLTASASCIPKAIRRKGKGKTILTPQLLANYASVAEVLSSAALFQDSYPNFYMVADQTRIAYIEVGLDGRYAVRSTADGVLYHTNYYLEAPLAASNLKIGKSSRLRYQRIRALLTGQPSGLTEDDFKRISNDTTDGPDCSLWRTGSKPGAERTVASWIVALPLNAPPELDVKLLNPGQPVQEFHLVLGSQFWQGTPTRWGK